MNKEMHTDIFPCLRDAVRRKYPQKLRTNSWFLPHDNAPAHWSGFLSKELSDNTAAPPHPTNPAPADLYLFPRLKSALKGRHFSDANDIVKNVTEELKRF
jgi:hypothetical protein